MSESPKTLSGFLDIFEGRLNKLRHTLKTELEKTKILIDAMSMQYLTGAVVDYKEDIQGSQFVIKNPNAETTCGCGSSFSV